jgi:peptidoglycan/LPS O-acetylase OafA/YrhL
MRDRHDLGKAARPQLTALTGLRFVLAVHVVLYHTAGEFFSQHAPLIYAIVQRGYLAPGAFFILSGLVITYSSAGRDSGAALSKRAFWTARFIRIYPTYLVSLAVALPIFLLQARHEPVQLLVGLATVPTLLQAWSYGTAQLWNGPGWSLSVEAFFYLVFPFIVPYFARWRGRRLLLGILASTAIAFVAPYLLIAVGLGSEGLWNPLVRLPEFVIGIMLGYLLVRNHAREQRGPMWERGCAMLAVTGAGILLAAWIAFDGRNLGAGQPAIFALPFAALIFGLAASRHGLARLLSHPAIVLLGEASYALYLLHSPIWDVLQHAIAKIPVLAGVAQQPWFIGLYLLFTIAASVLVFLRVERPARAALRSAFARRLSIQGVRVSESRPASVRRGV